MKPYTQPLKTILLAIILSFGVSFVYAWTGPTATPPAGNTTAPINTSADSQYKIGALGFGGLIHGYSNAIFDGNVGIGTNSPGAKLDVVGSVQAQSFLYSSDIRLKQNIQSFDNALEKLLKLNGVNFKWKSSGKIDIGLIAQDVEKVLPELVSTSQTTGLKSVEYGNLTAVLIEAIKEQQIKIDYLEAEIEKLKKQ